MVLDAEGLGVTIITTQGAGARLLQGLARAHGEGMDIATACALQLISLKNDCAALLLGQRLLQAGCARVKNAVKIQKVIEQFEAGTIDLEQARVQLQTLADEWAIDKTQRGEMYRSLQARLDHLNTKGAEFKTELQASHAHELKKLEDKLSKQEDRLSKQQAQTNALLEKLLNHTGSGM